MVGPASATDSNVVLFSGATGKLIKDSGKAFTPAGIGSPSGSGTSTGANTGDQTITLTGGVTGSGTGSFAATVQTNANLTGPINSVGNATSIASQTGAGTKFVMDSSPTVNQANLVGVTTNSNAAAGSVGEIIDSSVTGADITNSAANLTSIALTAGDWDVSAVVDSDASGVNAYGQMGISQTSGTITGAQGKDTIFFTFNTVPQVGTGVIPKLRVSLAGNATVYLVGYVGTATITGRANFYLCARRVR